MRYPDREEVFGAGDAWYAPPGHVPVQHDPGTEIVLFAALRVDVLEVVADGLG